MVTFLLGIAATVVAEVVGFIAWAAWDSRRDPPAPYPTTPWQSCDFDCAECEEKLDALWAEV